jgi:hypothetical protein
MGALSKMFISREAEVDIEHRQLRVGLLDDQQVG